MGAQQREYRQRSRSVQSTQKITRAMELIAASRVVKARQKVAESTPYASALTRAVSAVASNSNVDHPLTTEREDRRRAAVLIVTSDRGLAGAYSVNAIKESGELALSWVKSHAYDLYITKLRSQDPLKHPDPIDIHLHLPSGAVKKDGPSAGIAMVRLSVVCGASL